MSIGPRSTSTPNGRPPISTRAPQPIAFPIRDELQVRGIVWPGGPDTVLLLHDVGQDLDVWGSLPATLASRNYRVLAIDLPGHGLSDEPWEPDRAPGILATVIAASRSDAGGKVFVISIGLMTAAAGTQAIDALIAISPRTPESQSRELATAPCLIFAGGADPEAKTAADRFFRGRRGWTVVSSFGVAENGPALLTSAWAGQLSEQILAFLRDYRTAQTPDSGGRA